MGLFSIFNKKTEAGSDSRPDRRPDGGPATLAPLSDDASARLAANSEAGRLSQQARQRDIARATAMKIDAIESAMTFDIFNQPEPVWGSPRARPPRPRPPPASSGDNDDGNTLPLPDLETTLLLGGDDLPELAVAAETAPVVEEIAILYANGQNAVAQRMLEDSVADSGNRDRTVWWMLFDLYQVTDQRERFDNLSIDYASTFETSPPPWNPPAAIADAAVWSGVTPTEAFAGVLDPRIAPQLARLELLAADNPLLRLEFGRVTGVEAAGCALLLAGLRRLQAGRRGLILVGAAELATLLRAGIATGRRDDTETPWLLLLEVLQLLNREREFEQTAMDYCVTFEVSPPSFTAPLLVATAVASAAAQHAPASPDRFMLPPVIENQLGGLQPGIQDYAEQYQTLVFDCSRLTRIDYAGANQLLSRLQALARDGKKIEFRDVNHLVTALLRLLGFADIARIHPHRY